MLHVSFIETCKSTKCIYHNTQFILSLICHWLPFMIHIHTCVYVCVSHC